MRTTLNLDDDVLVLARGLAASRKISLGEAVSHLARRGARQLTPFTMKDGFPVFSVDPSTSKFGFEDVQNALDAEDLEYVRYFLTSLNPHPPATPAPAANPPAAPAKYPG